MGQEHGKVTLVGVAVEVEVADADTTYWIAIQWVGFFQPQWGISRSDTMQGSPVMMGFPLLGNDYWTPGNIPFGDDRNMAFKLTGVPVPEPASRATTPGSASPRYAATSSGNIGRPASVLTALRSALRG